MNTGLKNILKVLIGFIPAFMTFFLTKDWWFLAYFGAFIWFGITGLRNVLQAVLGGGGIRRSPLLRWNDIVSWDRITDSLLYTGFSVPLLDYVVKTVLLDRGLGITQPRTHWRSMRRSRWPTVSISAAIMSSGVCRTAAVFGNFFRTVLSIPIAYALNGLAAELLILGGVVGVELILQKWAAIISKLASDLVAGIIEGTVDRYQNVDMRWRDYGIKLSQIFDVYAQLELRFPESTALELLRSSEAPEGRWSDEIRELRRINIINALDLLYFWMYQPRARTAFKDSSARCLPRSARSCFHPSRSCGKCGKSVSCSSMALSVRTSLVHYPFIWIAPKNTWKPLIDGMMTHLGLNWRNQNPRTERPNRDRVRHYKQGP